MPKDIIKFVKSCRVCDAQKSSIKKSLGLKGKEKTAGPPFRIISLDLMGLLPC